jgi:saccharopine dehydrogenase-like NADP-dependent oxidoreductase
MKVLCLGAGGMGSLAAQTIAGFKEIDSITIADLRLEAAQKTAAGCQGKAQARSVNVEDKAGLVTLMKGHDVIANCIGPFFRFGVPILECAIAAGVNYFDICDDPEPSRDMLAMGAQAKTAGITAVVGLGASPGITNMLAAKVSRILTQMTELHAAWNIEEKTDDAPSGVEYSAAIVHWMKQTSGLILECRDGKLEHVKPLEEVRLYYPGREARTVLTVGHPEPVAFAWSYPGLKRSSCYMVMSDSTAADFKRLSAEIDSGAFTLEDAAHTLVDMSKSASMVERSSLPLLFVIGKGRIKDRNAIVAASIRSFPPGMAHMTGIPLAIGIHQFAKGMIINKGVATPEITLDADEFFRELAPYCTYPAPSTGDIVEIVREFE